MTNSFSYKLNTDDIVTLRTILTNIAGIGYSESTVCDRLGLKDICDLQMRSLPIYRKERLMERSHLDIAIDLFLLQGAIRSVEYYKLFNKQEFDFLVRIGILKISDNNTIQTTVALFPVKNRLFFSDHAWPQLLENENFTPPFDQVMFIGTDSQWLARATVRRPVSRALDLCTGSGIHALLAATHAKEVVAVDINPRAAACTHFNAQLCGADNIDIKIGDLYAPVGEQQFDLITANPPFVPAPADTLGFRDGGNSGEDVQRRIVAGLAKYLAPGGIAQIVTEVGESDGDPVDGRVRRWLEGAPMDIHVLRLRIIPAATYAMGHAQGDTPHAFLNSVEAWADNLRAQGFTRVVSVLLAFEWSEATCGEPFNRVDEAYPPVRDAGGEIEAAFAAYHLIQNSSFRQKLRTSRVARTGPVIVSEGRLLGSELPPTCRAVLSAQAMPVEYQLDSVERDLLDAIDNPVDVATLAELSRSINIDESTMYTALESLLCKRLISICV